LETTARRFWQATTLLPIVVPVACWPLLHGVAGTFFDFLSPIFALLLASIFVGGVPYLLVAGALLWMLRHREVDTYRRLSFVAPLTFAAALFVIFSAYVFFGTTISSFSTAAAGW